MDFIKRFTTNDVQTAKNVVLTLNPQDNVPAAIKLLVTENILSAPVVNEAGLVSVIDMLDICAFITSQFEGRTDEDHSKIQAHIQQSTVEQVLEFSANLPNRLPTIPVPEYANLASVFELLSALQVHRVPVVSSDGALVSVVSQSAVLRFIWDNISEIDIADKTLAELGFTQKKLLQVEEHQSVFEAFQLIKEHMVSAVAVVGKDGRLLGNVSCTDIRCLGPNCTLSERLQSSVIKFRQFMHDDFQAPKSVLTATSDSTLRDVIEMLVSNGLHRLWIVNEKQLGVGVLAIRDVLLLIWNNGMSD